MSNVIDYCRRIIKSLDGDLVRAQYSLAIYVASRNDKGTVNQELENALKSCTKNAANHVVVFNHIDLIHQQDAALTICRMMDKTNSTNSFVTLIKKAKSKRELLIDLAKAQYLRADIDSAHKALQDEYVKKQNARIDQFISIEKQLRNSDDYKKLKNLRDEVLAHHTTKARSSKAHINMVKNCLESLETLLHIAYSIFLNTDYPPRTGYEFAKKDAQKFWQLIIKSPKTFDA